jgi:bifunctional DNA-binding transcriptional regulator/antitoxin component of YhaV-PrlF toxin-antitoxin module
MSFFRVGGSDTELAKEIRRKLRLKEGDVIEVSKVHPDYILTPEDEAALREGHEHPGSKVGEG